MKANILNHAARIAKNTGNVFVATADTEGMAHLAAAGSIQICNKDHVIVTEWFCPVTIANLKTNKSVSIVAWDWSKDFGYQMLGKLEKIEDSAVMDGFAPELEKLHPLPQVEKKLFVRIEKIIDFKVAPHSDVEE